MNLEIFNVATQSVAAVGAFLVREDHESLNKQATELIGLPNEELQARCLQAIRGEDAQQVRKDEGLLRAITSYIPWFKRATSSLTIRRMGLAIEAFKRAPADLPPGSALYPQQVQAALSLTRRCLIQMDTGEGKTYALLPAAFALACEYYRVYIVCANEYLAWRDANRTRSFWEFVGLQHSLCLNKDTDDWSCRVIYTTLPALIFEHMRNMALSDTPSSPVTFGAILIDEADAILLDQGDQSFTLVQDIEAKAFDWSFALDYAKSLVEGEDIEVDYVEFKANLTIAGETRLRETLGRSLFEKSNYLLTRLAVELAYVAVKVAIEDRDYIVEHDRIYAVDRLTGKVFRNITPHWVIPLEVQKGFQTRAEKIQLDDLNTLTFLMRFQHLSGLSGTIADDALEYLFLYFLPTLIIKPRRKRHQGVKSDLIYRTREEAYDVACEEVLEVINANRPVLVGTQSIADAEKIYRLLSGSLPQGTRLSLLSGKNDYEAAQVFEHGGEAGSVIVATQLAGRGVDIRLSDAARRGGGLALICLGHSLTIRHDKQFLGRAGRQGDPFTARFICCYQDELFRQFVGAKLEKFMETMGHEHGVAIESRFVTRRIAAAQNIFRRRIFWTNQQQALLNTTSQEIRKSLENWFDYLQLADGNGTSPFNCSQEFLELAIDFHLKNILDGIPPGKKSLSQPEAEQIITSLNESLGLIAPPYAFSSLDIEGRDIESATSVLRALSLKKLNDAFAEYYKARTSALEGMWDNSEKTDESETEENVRVIPYEPYLFWRRLNDRTPRRIAYWSIHLCWIGFIQERSRIIHRAFQRRLSYLEHYRSITDQISNEWHQTERDMAIGVLRNLLRSAQPLTLDDLFRYDDHRVTDTHDDEKENLFAWESRPKEAVTGTTDPKENMRLLIVQFVAQAGSQLDSNFTDSNLRRLLDDFTQENALYTLQSPSKILKALESWSAAETERGVSTARRKAHKKWLLKFLLFLHERKLIGALPTFQTRLKSTLTKFTKTVSEPRTALTYIGIFAFLAFSILVTYFGNVAQPKQLGPFAAALDKILFAGLLAQGNIAAPSFGILILASVLTVFIFPQTADTPKDTIPFESVLVFLLQVVFAWWLTDWHYAQMTVASFMRSLAVFAAILVVAMISKRIVWLLESSFGLDLLAGWVGFSLLFAFLPAVVNGQINKSIAISFLVVSVVAYYVWQLFNSQEIELVSSLLTSSSTSMEVEEISGNLKVKADSGAAPHVYAVLFAWVLYAFLTLPAVASRVSLSSPMLLALLAAVYLLVIVLCIVHVMNRRFSIPMWETDLNERRQMIKDAHTSAELRRKLTSTKQRLLRRELAFQILIIVGAVSLFYSAVLPGTSFPLSLVIVFTVFLFGVTSKRIVLDLYKVLYNRMAVGIEVLDFSQVPEKMEKRSRWQLFKRTAKITFGLVIGTYGFLEVVSNIYEILEKLKIVR